MEQRTGTVAFRGLCDVTLSLSLNLVPVREDYTPDHAHTPNGATVRHCSLFSCVRDRAREWVGKGEKGEDVRGKRKRQLEKGR